MRTLPLRLAPVDGESLPGYVGRYSHTFQLPPGDLIIALGLTDGDTVMSAGRYGVTLSPKQLDHAGFATGITIETLQGMLLSRYPACANGCLSSEICCSPPPATRVTRSQPGSRRRCANANT